MDFSYLNSLMPPIVVSLLYMFKGTYILGSI